MKSFKLENIDEVAFFNTGFNRAAILKMKNGDTVQVIKQGGGLDIWAFPYRSQMTKYEISIFDIHMDNLSKLAYQQEESK